MKKLIIVIALASACFFANAQSKTLGGRINGLLGFGIEVEYEHYVANENFLNFGSQWLHSAYNVGLGIKYRW